MKATQGIRSISPPSASGRSRAAQYSSPVSRVRENLHQARATRPHVMHIAANTSTYNLGFPGMIQDLGCTEFQATIGLSMFTLGFGITPLVTASFSEEFGRQPMYIISAAGFALTHLMVALYALPPRTHSPVCLTSRAPQRAQHPDGAGGALPRGGVWVHLRYNGTRPP